MAVQREVGAQLTRLFIPWSEVQPQPPDWDFALPDEQYQEILAGGLRPVIVAQGSPCWASPPGCLAGLASPPEPLFDGAWAAYVRQLALRYPRAAAIEIWNEPNLDVQFWPRADPLRYEQLLAEAYGAVKAVDPAMPVISGGLLLGPGSGFGPGGEAGFSFQAAMLAAGAGRYMNGLGIHIYPFSYTPAGRPEPWNAALAGSWLRRAQAQDRAAGIAGKPIWITEMGVSTSTEAGFPPAASFDEQAADLKAMLQTARGDPLVQAALIDSLQDADPNLPEDLIGALGAFTGADVFFNAEEEGLGVFTDTWQAKPAACVVSLELGGTLPC